MSKPIPIPKLSPLVNQIMVIRALFHREVVTRFGHYRLGFLWMLIEPLMAVLVLGLIVGTLTARTVPEIPYPFFLLNGFLVLDVFTSPIRSGLGALGSNRGLLVYPNVNLLDPFIARFLFDLVTTLFSYALFCIVALWMGINISLGNLHIIALGFLLIWMTGCGFGLMGGVAVAYYKELEKVIPILLRPLLFVSAVIIPLSTLPASAQKYLTYNPLVHAIELNRNALFPFYHADGLNLTYPAEFAVVTLALGLTLFNSHLKFLSKP